MLKTGTTRFSIASGSRKRISKMPFSTAQSVTCSALNPLGTGTTRSNSLDLSSISPVIFNLSLSASSSMEISLLEYPATANLRQTSLSSAGRRVASIFPDATGIATTGMVIFGTAMRKTPSITAAFAFSMSCVALRLSLIFNDEEGNATVTSEELGTSFEIETPFDCRVPLPRAVTVTSLLDAPGTFICISVPLFVSFVSTRRCSLFAW